MTNYFTSDILDRITKQVLKRTILENSRLTDIISSEIYQATGTVSASMIDQARTHLLMRLGLDDRTDFGSTIERK